MIAALVLATALGADLPPRATLALGHRMGLVREAPSPGVAGGATAAAGSVFDLALGAGIGARFLLSARAGVVSASVAQPAGALVSGTALSNPELALSWLHPAARLHLALTVPVHGRSDPPQRASRAAVLAIGDALGGGLAPQRYAVGGWGVTPALAVIRARPGWWGQGALELPVLLRTESPRRLALVAHAGAGVSIARFRLGLTAHAVLQGDSGAVSLEPHAAVHLAPWLGLEARPLVTVAGRHGGGMGSLLFGVRASP